MKIWTVAVEWFLQFLNWSIFTRPKSKIRIVIIFYFQTSRLTSRCTLGICIVFYCFGVSVMSYWHHKIGKYLTFSRFFTSLHFQAPILRIKDMSNQMGFRCLVDYSKLVIRVELMECFKHMVIEWELFKLGIFWKLPLWGVLFCFFPEILPLIFQRYLS